MDIEVEVADSVSSVPRASWDALVGADNPFVEHAFLSLLEDSESVGAGTGWLPAPILVRTEGRLIGAAPAYVKSDSYGEYIFDWSFAQAAARARIPYYPKLVVAVPFTPATGPRLLVHPDFEASVIRRALLAGMNRLRQATQSSSIHILFSPADEAHALSELGLLHRTTHQYHFTNPGYGSFDDFLGELRSEDRKQIRRERRKVSEQGIETELRRGDQLSVEEWSILFELYTSTSGRKWGRPYLTRAFFERASAYVGHRALVGFARDRRGEILAGTLSFEKGACVYGRYWGSFGELDGVHFELCYYQLIDHLIRTKKSLLEAGAQGEHKIKRGFRPSPTHSLHHFESSGLARAAARAFHAESAELPGLLETLSTHLPFRRR
ncbi:MAG: GNAT family N-acetyltransferase [Deltaproteobacteria bacterium]|nr:GNAT family N-acetyltransferase [Deltaproteobacteria bacterium]